MKTERARTERTGIGATMQTVICRVCRTELEEIDGRYFHRQETGDHRIQLGTKTVLIQHYPSFDVEVAA